MSHDRRTPAPLAVVGIACRFPGADDSEAFWNLLREGRSGIAELPPERLDQEMYYAPQRGVFGRSHCRRAGIVDPHPVAPDHLPLPPEFASHYDDFHLALCEVVAAACRDAGCDPLAMPAAETGFFLGNADGSDLPSNLALHTHAQELAELLRDATSFEQLSPSDRSAVIDEITATIRRRTPSRAQRPVEETAAHAAAALVAKVLRLTGPSIAVDAACASSFAALLLAGQALECGRIETAIVAGASMRKWYELVMLSHIQSIGTEESRPFDAAADGFIGSDGYAAVLVKTLPRALADRDTIHGVIRGIGMSSDGRGKSFWAPRQEGQVAAIRRAYDSGIEAERLQFIEAHATSTRLGDSTEIASLTEALGSSLARPIPVSSVKANIGHTLEVAGLAGLIKTLLAMRHRIIPPAIHCETPNPNIPWDRVPFHLPQRELPWPEPSDGGPRRAGIDSFGIGGLNLHVVVDDAPEPAETRAVSVPAGQPETDADMTETATVIREKPWPDGIAIVGRGCVYPGAYTVAAFEQLLSSARDPKSPVPAGRWNSQSADGPLAELARDGKLRGGFITDYEFDWKKHRIPPKQIACADPLQFMLLDAVEQALREAGSLEDDFDRSRTATVVGTIFTGDFACDTYLGVRLPEIRQAISEALQGRCPNESDVDSILVEYADVLHERKPARFDESASYSSSTLASRITKAFDLMGGAFALDAGDASSLAALQAASGLLLAGQCDLALCASGQRTMGLVEYDALARTGKLASAGPRSPLDIEAHGCVPGEGVGAVVLKRLADAVRDGDEIQGVIRGIGVASHADSADAASRAAFRKAIHVSRTEPTAIRLVELATSNPAHAALEVAAIDEICTGSERNSRIHVGSLAAQIGDLQAAAGMAGLLKQTIEVERAATPADFGLSRPLPLLSEPSEIFASPTRPMRLTATPGRNSLLGMVASISDRGYGGNGGLAHHLILEARIGGSDIRNGKSGTHGTLRSDGFPQTANIDAISNDELERELIAFTIARTGVPSPIVSMDARFDADLMLQPGERNALLSEFGSRFGIDGVPSWKKVTTLEDFVEYLRTSTPTQMTSESETDSARADLGEPTPPETSKRNSERQAATVEPDQTATATVSTRSEEVARRRTRRFVLRSVPLAPPENDVATAPTFHGPAIVLGENPTATALGEALRELGVTVHALAVGENDLVEDVLAEFDRLWESGPLPHLFLTTARDEAAAIRSGSIPGDSSVWENCRRAGIELPFLVCRRWFESIENAKLVERASLVAVTALGGDFGFGGHLGAAEGGAWTGLLKAIHVETRGRLRVRIVDAPLKEPPKLIAKAVLRELAIPGDELETGSIRGSRHVVRAVSQEAATLPQRPIRRNSVWVVTGGARGITAAIAREFGRRFELRLHLIGTTSLDDFDPQWRELSESGREELKNAIQADGGENAESSPVEEPRAKWGRIEKMIDIDRNIREMRAAGVAVSYHACDVVDRNALAAVLREIRSTDGPIEGIIHGAGYESAAPFRKKTREDLARTLRGKVEGATALMSLTVDDPLSHFIAFGSTSGRFGGMGQTDYALANELLAKLVAAHAAQRPECRSVTIHWSAWDEVGMAQRPKSRTLLNLMNVVCMPLADGVEHFLEESQVDSPDTEILIADHPDGFFSRHVVMPDTKRDALDDARREDIADSPLIVDAWMASANEGIAHCTFDPKQDPFLTGHLDGGTPLFPAVVAAETCAEAAAIVSGGRVPVRLRELRLLNGFRMANGRRHRAAVSVRLDGDVATCKLAGEFHDKHGRFVEPHRIYQSCLVELADRIPSRTAPDFGPVPETWEQVSYPDDWRKMSESESGTVYYGPELRTLKEIHHDANGCWGRLIAPSPDELGGERPGRRWLTPAALLDGLLFSCDLYASRALGTRQLPHVIEEVEFGRMPRPGEVCLSRASYQGAKGRELTFEFWLIGDDGEILLHTSGCRVVRLDFTLKDAMSGKS